MPRLENEPKFTTIATDGNWSKFEIGRQVPNADRNSSRSYLKFLFESGVAPKPRPRPSKEVLKLKIIQIIKQQNELSKARVQSKNAKFQSALFI